MTVLGGLCLWIAFLVGIWGALAGFVGGRSGRRDLEQSARHAVFAMSVALWVAVAALEWALFQHDFNVEYVASYTSRNLPIFYTWSALYAGQKGSLLFWASVLSLFGSLAMVLTSRRHRALLPYEPLDRRVCEPGRWASRPHQTARPSLPGWSVRRPGS